MAQSYSLDDVFKDDEPSTTKTESYSLDDVFKQESPKGKSKGWAESLDPTLRKTIQIGLPMAGAVAGGMLAAPLTGGTSALGALGLLAAAEGVGSLGGESINQALGISPESTTEKAIALGAPLGGRALFGAIENIPRWIPGFGTALKGALTPEARDLPGKLLGGGKGSKQIYDELAQQAVSNTKIQQFPSLGKTVNELSQQIDQIPWPQLQTQLKENGLENLLSQISGSLSGVGGAQAGLTFNEARKAIEGFGKVIGGTTDPALRGSYKQLYKSLLDDLENAVPPSGASGKALQLWKDARGAYKKEQARFALQEVTERSITTKEGVDLFNPDAMVKWLKGSAGKKEIGDRLGQQELRRITNEYRYMAAVAGHNMPKFFAMAAGGGLGTILGGAGWGVGGASAGLAAAEGLSRLMMTEQGRSIVRKLATDPRHSTFRKIGAALGAAGAGASSFEGDEE